MGEGREKKTITNSRSKGKRTTRESSKSQDKSKLCCSLLKNREKALRLNESVPRSCLMWRIKRECEIKVNYTKKVK